MLGLLLLLRSSAPRCDRVVALVSRIAAEIVIPGMYRVDPVRSFYFARTASRPAGDLLVDVHRRFSHSAIVLIFVLSVLLFSLFFAHTFETPFAWYLSSAPTPPASFN